ncbi:WhiB family transcriptional regulator [Streptomonospora litoralis]|uniref:Transcriptional regulator WhiB n=1 Tax=Streptomonospora litoralis TaxID=2498135 RepID=A0A4P6Q3K4_9ACTN|nr:WhiB family transcriptional regulator [Streptomonospora litoralis]QBI53479.1 Transcriptional regulator WhiB [Streptomonospora litoralis]
MTDANARARMRRQRQDTYDAWRRTGATIAQAAAELQVAPGIAARYYEPLYRYDTAAAAIPHAAIDTGRRRWPADQDWRSVAACTGPDVEADWWTEVRGYSTYATAPETAQLAVRICRTECPVRPECLDDALSAAAEQGQPHETIRGGYTPRELRRLDPATDEAVAS